jgi:Cof subfamily protein (haloacid dehalogenase superfamily)
VKSESGYKLLLFDLDGTLLTEDRQVSERNRRMLGALMSSGLRVGLATGRPLLSAEPYARAIAANGPMILFNGARVWDPLARKYVFSENLSRAEALRALEMASGLPDTHLNLYVDDQILIAKRTPLSIESEEKDGVPHTIVGDLHAWLSARTLDPIKLMLIAEPGVLEPFAERFRQTSDGSTNLIRSERTYLEFTRKGVSKGAALAGVLGHYGLGGSEVIAFGDGLNDIELLQACGLGVAMENAHPGLKKVASRVIGHHSTPAISEFLAQTFGVRE